MPKTHEYYEDKYDAEAEGGCAETMEKFDQLHDAVDKLPIHPDDQDLVKAVLEQIVQLKAEYLISHGDFDIMSEALQDAREDLE